MGDQALLKLRQRIDALDDKILQLISERAQCAEQVAHIKLAEDANATFYRPEREAQILARMQALNPGPLRAEQISRLYREIIASCLALEESMCIAYLGPEGTFTHEATLKHFGQDIATLPVNSIGQVFREVQSGRVRYGVVPIENSTEGVVNHTLDMFMQSPLRICGEISLRIHQNLLSLQQDLSKIKMVYSHQQSLAQCRYWLDHNLPHAERIAVNSNTEAARLCSDNPEAAAIGPAQAAALYQLRKIHQQIEDNSNNTTRFLVIGEQIVAPSGRDKTSLMVSSPNRPGILFKILQPLAENGLDMNRIESRPSKLANWEYVFFFDVLCHEQDEKMQKALKTLTQEAEFIKILGSYPVAII